MHAWTFAPPEVRRDIPRVVLCGREEVLVEQHEGLFSYETRCIRARTKSGLLTVTGEGLIIAHFGAQDMLIRGTITAVQIGDETI